MAAASWVWMILLTAWVNTAAASISLRYNKEDSILHVRCNFSPGSQNMGHSNQLDNSDYSGDYSGLEDATEVCFDRCSMQYVPIKFFQKIRLVEKVSMTDSGVLSVKNGDFLGNDHLTVLTMNENCLVELPEYLFVYTKRLEEVDFSYNKLRKISTNTFAGARRLQKIDLSFNFIKTLDANLFEAATAFKDINFRHNLLQHFKPKLSKLNKLQLLSLDGNRLTQLDCTTFPKQSDNWVMINASNNKLKTIDLNCDIKYDPNGNNHVFLNVSNNQIRKLQMPNSALVNGLEMLIAKNNKIDEILITNDLPGLKRLDLADNNLENVLGIFEHCSSLKELDLSNNNIRELCASSSTKLNQLKTLRLNNNNLSKIDTEIFSSSRDLLSLDLSHNRLDRIEIDFESFGTKYDQSATFKLNDNHLKELTGWSSSPLPKLNRLNMDISNNKFDCFYLERLVATLNASGIHLFSSKMPDKVKSARGIRCTRSSNSENDSLEESWSSKSQEDKLHLAKNSVISICAVCLLLLSLAFIIVLKFRRHIYSIEHYDSYEWGSYDEYKQNSI